MPCDAGANIPPLPEPQKPDYLAEIIADAGVHGARVLNEGGTAAGPQGSIFGSDSQEVADLVDQLVNQVSRVNLNAQYRRGPGIFPFTGRKDSAEGILSVYDALHSFSIRTVVATK